MNKRFAEVAFETRRRAGLTAEHAAELLGIAARTLVYYEAGRKVPDEIVARMVQAYDSPEIGYYWLSRELHTGRVILPPVDAAGISSRALRLRISIRHAETVQDALEGICWDDCIEDHEKEPLAAAIGKIRELAAACMNVAMLGRWSEKEKAALDSQHGNTEKMIHRQYNTRRERLQ